MHTAMLMPTYPRLSFLFTALALACAAAHAAPPASPSPPAPSAPPAAPGQFYVPESLLKQAAPADPKALKKLKPRPADVCMQNRKTVDEAVVACMTGEGPVPK